MPTPRQTLISVYNSILPYKDELAYTEGDTRSMSNAFSWSQALARLKAKLGLTGDCVSLGVTAVFKWAGWGDPNGLGFDGYGFTGTIMDHLPRITDVSGVHEGSIGIYGEYPGVHAIVALENYKGADTKINSHGMPLAWQSTLGIENTGHVGQPLTWYAVAGLAPEVPKSYHFDRFDPTILKLPNSTNSERGVIESYVKNMKHPILNKLKLKKQHKNLIALHQRVVNNSRIPPGPDADYRHWREQILALAVAGRVIKPS
jgi:hypothetical protein